MVNLLEETLNELQDYGKTIEDVKWIGTDKYIIPIERFVKIADQEYDNDYGGEEVCREIVVVGDSWWLERGEYDGSEWWDFKILPSKPSTIEEDPEIFINQMVR